MDVYVKMTRNYSGHAHIKDIFSKKMAATTININLQERLFQIGWIIINAI